MSMEAPPHDVLIVGAGQAGLTCDLTDLLEPFNQGGADTLAVPSEYLEVVATRARRPVWRRVLMNFDN